MMMMMMMMIECDFYPRDAMLAWVWPCVCLSVCLSQVGVLLKWLDGSSLFLERGLLSTSPTLCFKEIQVSTKIRVLPSVTFFVNSGLKKISPRPIVDRRTCYQLISRKVDAQSVINWTVLCQLS